MPSLYIHYAVKYIGLFIYKQGLAYIFNKAIPESKLYIFEAFRSTAVARNAAHLTLLCPGGAKFCLIKLLVYSSS